MSKKAKKDKKSRPQPKPNWQIPNSMIRKITLYGPRYYLQHAREYPILGCWIMAGWFEAGITSVVVAREMAPDKVLFAHCIVDLTCLGVKVAHARTDISLSQFMRTLPELCNQRPEKCSPELAHEVIYGAIEYAERYGFNPHPDFKIQLVDLVLDPPDAHPRVDNVAFGKDGKPFYVSGPYDDDRKSQSVINTLMRTAGQGNFDYILAMDGTSDLLTLDDLDDDIDFDDDVISD